MTLDSERYKKKGKLWSLIQRIFVKKKVKKVRHRDKASYAP